MPLAKVRSYRDSRVESTMEIMARNSAFMLFFRAK
jgi:hypothetical protein